MATDLLLSLSLSLSPVAARRIELPEFTALPPTPEIIWNRPGQGLPALHQHLKSKKDRNIKRPGWKARARLGFSSHI
jgi:hypothetical protein